MTWEQLYDVASREKGNEEWIGQAWIEREKILYEVNCLPPQMREKRARQLLSLLSRRVEREGTDQGHASVFTTPNPGGIDPGRIRERF